MRIAAEGRIFDESTSERIGECSFGQKGEADYSHETLLKDETGEFYLLGTGGEKSYYGQLFEGRPVPGTDVIPLSPSEARRWLEDVGQTETVLRLFGEQSASADSPVRIFLPRQLRRAIEQTAANSSMKLEDWIVGLIVEKISANSGPA